MMKTLLLSALLVALPAAATESSPISLTASDGSGLRLTKLVARGVVQDPLAFTELTLTFQNPLDRELEGRFHITLPPGAAVSRFAMKVDGRWQEGEVVERQAARRAYEDFLHRRQDPALLEQGGANEFTARVYPIPPRGVKELVVSYSHELVSATASYVLPLKGLPEVGELDVQLSGVAKESATLAKKRFVPNADFVAAPARNAVGVRSGEWVVARVVPLEKTEPEPVSSLLLLVDSSASRALGYREQLSLVQKLVAELGRGNAGGRLTVALFDQGVEPVYEGTFAGFGEAQLKRMRDWRALGASNLEAALAFAAKRPQPRVVLVTDGVATAGASEGPNLLAAALRLKGAGVERLDAVALGGIRDEAALARLVTAGLRRDGAVIDGTSGPVEVARRLRLTTRSKLPVKVEGASFSWPTTLSGVQAGDAALVYAVLPAASPLRISVAGRPVVSGGAGLSSIERPLLKRAWAKAKIAALLEEIERADGKPERERVKQQVIELSTRHRVLSPYTALLVLETEADYARFDIDRRALADILTVEGGRVAVLRRSADSLVIAKTPPVAKSKAKNGEAEKKSDGLVSTDGHGEAEGGAPTDALEAAEPEADEGAAPAEVAAPEPAPVGSVPPAAPPPASGGAPSRRAEVPREERSRERRHPGPPSNQPWNKGSDPYTGKLKEVMAALAKGEKAKALAAATGWREESPGDVLALVAMGEALEASGDLVRAARAYGSIIDLFPARADLRRFAGVRLERIAAALSLAADSFAKAAEQRPDHPASHRLLAFALLRAGQPEAAFRAIERGLSQRYPSGRFAGVDRILREDAGLIAAAWIKAEPSRKEEILRRLSKAGGTAEDGPSLRFVLNWETDANDVDFHITDGRGGHAYYSQKTLASGGELYADVTTGYGPECFTIRGPAAKRAYPYRLQAHYYSIGPMGAGMGKLEVIEHDGRGGLRFEQRPYVVMVNQAYVDLGVVQR